MGIESYWGIIGSGEGNNLAGQLYNINHHPSVATWLVRGEQLPEPDSCPIEVTEMTRQQALEYIEHLSTQLVDPKTTVVTPLIF